MAILCWAAKNILRGTTVKKQCWLAPFLWPRLWWKENNIWKRKNLLAWTHVKDIRPKWADITALAPPHIFLFFRCKIGLPLPLFPLLYSIDTAVHNMRTREKVKILPSLQHFLSFTLLLLTNIIRAISKIIKNGDERFLYKLMEKGFNLRITYHWRQEKKRRLLL